MRWYELCENSDAIPLHYSNPPALDRVMIRELALMGDAVRIYLDLTRPPDRPPVPPGSAVARLGLAIWSIANLELCGAVCDKSASLTLTRPAEGPLHLQLLGENSRLIVQCRFAMIESFTVFADESVRQNTRTLFSYPNVWNSCLLTLQSEGYDLELSGDPDQPSHCQWRARRGGLVLKAPNPIELLGLAEVARRAPPGGPRDRWWQMAGPNIAHDLITSWQAKWLGPRTE